MIFLAFLFCFWLRIDDTMTFVPTNDSIHIREVWNDNLENEFALIRDIVDDYPYIGMDTEFPGVVINPSGDFKSWSDHNFHTIIANVNILKLIQLGLTFSDANGVLPTCGTGKYCLWQFNFREFNVDEDKHAPDSINLLINSGIDFKKNNEKGVDAKRFSELLFSSGIVLNDSVRWLTFHSAYDFAYLLKLLTWKSLPDTEGEFFDLLRMYFPVIYDVKQLMKFCDGLHGGLNKLARQLDVKRVGNCHQAGSDSLLTCSAYMKLKQNFFNGSPVKHSGVVNLLHSVMRLLRLCCSSR